VFAVLMPHFGMAWLGGNYFCEKDGFVLIRVM
jgi:hypothetical protein